MSMIEGRSSQVNGSDHRWRGVIAGGGEQLQVEASFCMWRGAKAGGGELWFMEGSDDK